MSIFKNILHFYIESSLHVAFAVYALVQITFLKLNISPDDSVAHFAFCGTIVGYNFIKYDELARVKKIKLTSRFKAIIILSALSFLGALYSFLELQSKTKFIGFITLIITLLYTLPFFPNKENMRNWSGLKIYLVALAWVFVTVILPAVNANYNWDSIIALKSLQRFILVFILMLIFEIIDLKVDNWLLKTIPQQIGIPKTKLLAYWLLIIFIGLDSIINTTVKNIFPTLSIAVIIAFFTHFASIKRNTYYTSFWVESIPIFWFILLLL